MLKTTATKAGGVHRGKGEREREGQAENGGGADEIWGELTEEK